MMRKTACATPPPALAAASLVLGLLLAPPAGADDRRAGIPGFVDGSTFIEIVGDDAVTVEFSLQGPLLKALTKIDPELAELAGGLESIHAVILTLGDEATSTRLISRVRETERNLSRLGWEVLLRVQEPDSRVKVLYLGGEESIQGLVVMVVDTAENQLVFANVAGRLDLAAIARIGEEWDVPGLDELKSKED